METPSLHPLLEDLTANIDDLEETLAPLLQGPLSHQTSKLPLLDQAKLCVLATYAIESLLFSSLRLHGVDAKAHPVFAELGRVRGYFDKIRAAEGAGAGARRNLALDKVAAGRFVRAGLVGNEKFDRERIERLKRDKVGAKRKLEQMSAGTHTRFDGAVEALEGEGGRASATTALRAEEDSGDGAKSKGDMSGRFGSQYADLMAQDASIRATEDDGEGDDDAESGEEITDRMEARAGRRGPEKKRQKAPKNSKEALESLLEGAIDGQKKRKRRKKLVDFENERAEEMK